MPWRLLVGTVALLTGVPALPAAGQSVAAEPVAQSQVTAYQARLQVHADRVVAVRAEIARLLTAPPSANAKETEQREIDIQRSGAALLSEGRSLKATVDAFMQGETRRGLDAEIDLVRAATNGVAGGLVDFRRLSGVQYTPATTSDEPWALALARQLVVDEIPSWVENKWQAAALQDVVSAKNATDLKAKVRARLRTETAKVIDAETRRIFGVGFHDRRSLHHALRLRVNLELDRQATALLFSLGAEGVVIELFGGVVASLLRDVFWNQLLPALKELARGKGNLEQRVSTSMSTMESARARLWALPPDANLKDAVYPALRNANNRITATRYLVNDLKRRKQAALLANLGGAITDLERARSITIRRFLLDKVEAVQRLAADRAALSDTIDELATIVKEPPTSCVLAPEEFSVTVSEPTLTQGSQPDRKGYQWTVTYTNKSSTTVYVPVHSLFSTGANYMNSATWTVMVNGARIDAGKSFSDPVNTYNLYPGGDRTWHYNDRVVFLRETEPACRKYLGDEAFYDQVAVPIPNPIPA